MIIGIKLVSGLSKDPHFNSVIAEQTLKKRKITQLNPNFLDSLIMFF